MNTYAKIRAALEVANRKTDVFDAAWGALAELERRASRPLGTMASGGSAHGRPFTIFTSFDLPPGTPVYSAPPVPAGMFTAEEMAASWICGNRDNCNLEESDTYKLIQERTKC